MHANGRLSRPTQLRARFARHRGLAVTIILGVVGACRPDSAGVTDPHPSAAFAKAGSSTVEVTSVTPSEAPTDTIIDVLVNGKGFSRGASAKWSLNGDTTRVHVLSTTYVNGGQLKARLQVPVDAPTGSYDVEVYLVDGKKGVGAELFLVVQKFQSASSATYNIPATGYSFTSWGNADYADGVCGVLARVFYLAPNYLDGNMQLDNPRSKDRSCGTSPRKRITTYPATSSRPQVADTATGDMNIKLMGTVTLDSGTVQRPMNIAIAGSGTYCTRLAFGNDFGTPLGATKTNVTRLNATQWRVESLPGGSTAACVRPNGEVELIYPFIMSFTVTVQP